MLSISISNEPRALGKGASFRSMAEEVLGDSYDLSLAFVTPAKIAKLNKIYRGKNEPTDILSFPLDQTHGEIYICMSEAKKEAKKFDRKIANFVDFLFIHGCVHLKGHDHGGTMERIEEKVRRRFKV